MENQSTLGQETTAQQPGAGNGSQSNTQQGQQERLFTQEDVNRIVGERLARVKAPGEPDQRELDLQARENALYIRERVTELGLPKEMIEEFKGMDKATIDKCIKIITPYAQKMKEPFMNPVGAAGGQSAGTDEIRTVMGLK